MVFRKVLNKYLVTNQVAQWLRICLPMQEMQVQSLGQEDALEEEMATHHSILACRIQWAEQPGGLQSMGSQRIRYDLTAEQARANHDPYTRKPTSHLYGGTVWIQQIQSKVEFMMVLHIFILSNLQSRSSWFTQMLNPHPWTSSYLLALSFPTNWSGCPCGYQALEPPCHHFSHKFLG